MLGAVLAALFPRNLAFGWTPMWSLHRLPLLPTWPHLPCLLLPSRCPAEHPDPNTSEAHLEVWLQQVSKRWSEVPHMAEAIKKVGGVALVGREGRSWEEGAAGWEVCRQWVVA